MPELRVPRERTEELERASLSGWATLSAESKGREQAEAPDPLRTAFQVDIDRIVCCEAFARLQDKRQTLVDMTGRGWRTRLDHTLAGTRAARTIARALRLNEDLTEAIALGRDLGATAFATAGDEALSLFTDEPFRHNHQSLRVVEQVAGGQGLNLSWEVRDGISCHTLDSPTPATREGEAVRLTGHLVAVAAEVHHVLGSGFLLPEELPDNTVALLGPGLDGWLDLLLEDCVRASTDIPEIRLSRPAWAAVDALHTIASDRLRSRPGLQAERARGSHCLSSLVVFHLDNPGRMPAAFRVGEDPLVVRVLDFVASLSDRQALTLFDELFVPGPPSSHR